MTSSLPILLEWGPTIRCDIYYARMSTQTAATVAVRTTSTKEITISIVAWLFIAFLAILAVMTLKPSHSVAATASTTEFSAERALVHVRAIASVPRPLGSEADATARRYLVDQLSVLGMSPQVFDETGISNRPSGITIAPTHDIVGRLHGAASSGAVMLMAHYDSVRNAPGAADDGAGIASILECIRAVRAGRVLKNDLIVLFTDGEEAGLLGAEAFAAAHPWRKDISMVINFEARGNQGPSMLFETGADNSLLVEATAQAAPHPIGSSFFYALYKLLPNDTDFTVFRAHKIPGLNFAFGENLDAYHTRLDTTDALSLDSLQHHGSYALGLTEYFGQMDLGRLKASRGDDVFFDWLGSSMIVYNERWVLPGEILVTALLVFAIVLSARKSRARVGKIMLAMLASFAVLLALPIVLAIVNFVFSRVLAGRMIVADSQANLFFLTAYVLLGICTAGAMFAWLRKRFSLLELSLGGLLLVDILSLLLALKLPAGSYLLFWPLLLVTLGLLVTALGSKEEPSGAQAVAGWGAIMIAVLLFAPIVYLIYVFLTLQVIAAAATGILIVCFFLIALPCMNTALPPSKWHVAILILAAGALSTFGIGTALSHDSAQHPKRDTVIYSINADSRSAAWISPDRFLDKWTSQFFPNKQQNSGPMPDYLAGLDRPVRFATAPVFELAAPTAEIQSDQTEGDTRKLRMHLKSQRSAPNLLMTFAKDVRVMSIKIGPQEIVPIQNSASFSMNMLGMDVQGIDLQITIKAQGKTSFWLMDQSSGFPAETMPRPNEVMAGSNSDMTFVCRKYSL